MGGFDSSWTRTMALAAALLALAAGVAGAVDWRPALVEMSDGTKYDGKIYLNEGKIRLHHADKKKFYWVKQEEIKHLETIVKKQWMEKKWLWKEDGRDFKVYTGDTYPIVHLKTRITFGDGNTFEGPCYARAVYIDVKGKRTKKILLKQMEGKVGQTFKDLVYVKKITFRGEAKGVRGSIAGRVKLPAGETFLKAHALNRENEYVVEGKLAGNDGFRITDCMAGTYDLVVRTDKSYYLYFSREKDEGCRRFDANTLEDIHTYIMKIKDLWENQDFVYGGGNEKRAYVFVRMERRGGLAWSDPAKWAWVKLLRRNEVLLMTKPYDEWQVSKRYFIGRELLADANDEPEKIIVAPQLGGHVVDLKNPNLFVSLKLGPTKEVVVPQPPKEAEENDGD